MKTLKSILKMRVMLFPDGSSFNVKDIIVAIVIIYIAVMFQTS